MVLQMWSSDQQPQHQPGPSLETSLEIHSQLHPRPTDSDALEASPQLSVLTSSADDSDL